MSRRTARNKSRHVAQKAARPASPSSPVHTHSGNVQTINRTAAPARRAKRSAEPGRNRNPNTRRYTGKAYRRSGWSGHTWLNTLLGVAIIGLFAYFGYLWYTKSSAPPSSPASNGPTSGTQTNADAPKAIPTYQQKSGVIWSNQELTGELSTQVSQTLHLSANQIETDLQTLTMVQLAEQQGLTADQWHTTILNALKNDLQNLVSSGQFTQSDADTNNTFYAQHPDHLDDALASLFNGHMLEHTPTTSQSTAGG